MARDVVHAAAEAVGEVEPVGAAEALAADLVVALELRVDGRRAAGGGAAGGREEAFGPGKERRGEGDGRKGRPDRRPARRELAPDEAVRLDDGVEVVEHGDERPVAGGVAAPGDREGGVPEEEAAEVSARGEARAERDGGFDLGLFARDIVHLAAGDRERAVAEAADEAPVGCVVFHGARFYTTAGQKATRLARVDGPRAFL